MIGHNQVCPVTDKQPRSIHATLVKQVYLTNQYGRIDDHAVTNNRNSLGRKNAGRDQVQPKFAPGIDYSMPGIITAGETHYHLCFFSKQVNHLTLTFIPPLSSNNSNGRHYYLLQSSIGTKGSYLVFVRCHT